MTLPTDDMTEQVTQTALKTFSRAQQSIAGEIAYQNGGAALFEQFVQNNPYYYQYMGEIELIDKVKRGLLQEIDNTEHLIVVGPGPASSFSRKEMQIAKILPNLKSMTSIDISQKFNDEFARVVGEHNTANNKNIAIETHHMDFREACHVLKPKPHTTVISTGGLITNIPNAPLNGFPDTAMQDTLLALRMLADDDGHVLIGYDSNNNPDTLKKAYNDQLAPFIINISTIIADHCKGIKGFKAGKDYFKYQMHWSSKGSQVSHNLVATQHQIFQIEDDTRTYNFVINEDDEFTCISSVKPQTGKMTILGDFVGLKTSLVMSDRHNIAFHAFNCAAIPAKKTVTPPGSILIPSTPIPA